jgi:uncharacterized membrane protein (DUF106 family)
MLTVILSGIGATVIITQSRLFLPIQKLGKFFQCTICIGFWVGVYFNINNSNVIEIFKMGCITSISSYTWYLIFKNRIE